MPEAAKVRRLALGGRSSVARMARSRSIRVFQMTVARLRSVDPMKRHRPRRSAAPWNRDGFAAGFHAKAGSIERLAPEEKEARRGDPSKNRVCAKSIRQKGSAGTLSTNVLSIHEDIGAIRGLRCKILGW